jgi:hypothetical protein
MIGAKPLLPQYAFIAWCSVKKNVKEESHKEEEKTGKSADKEKGRV